MTKREKIATRITTELSAIRITGGYRVDFPTAKHWSRDIESKDTGKFVSVEDRLNTNTSDDESEIEILNVEIILGCCITDANYTTINKMIDDVKRWYSLNKRALEVDLNLPAIKFISDEIGIDRFEKEVGAGKVIFAITTGQNCNWIYDGTVY